MFWVIRGESPCSMAKTWERPLKLDSNLPKNVFLFGSMIALSNDEKCF